MTATQHNLIPTIEALSFKALPALETRHYDGWLLRYADGYTKRANSVNPVYSSTEEVNSKIELCESFYTDKNCPTIFKLTDKVFPSDLDTILAQRGYRKEAETYVYTLSLIGQGNPASNVQIDTQLRKTWVHRFAQLNRISEENVDTLHQMLSKIQTPCGYVEQRVDGDVVGVALGVVDDDWMGVFDVVIHPDFRGRGFGRTIMEALLNWGVGQGASKGYLQVQADNTVATTLYRALGFHHQYAYWYRIKDLPSTRRARH